MYASRKKRARIRGMFIVLVIQIKMGIIIVYSRECRTDVTDFQPRSRRGFFVRFAYLCLHFGNGNFPCVRFFLIAPGRIKINTAVCLRPVYLALQALYRRQKPVVIVERFSTLFLQNYRVVVVVRSEFSSTIFPYSSFLSANFLSVQLPCVTDSTSVHSPAETAISLKSAGISL